MEPLSTEGPGKVGRAMPGWVGGGELLWFGEQWEEQVSTGGQLWVGTGARQDKEDIWI